MDSWIKDRVLGTGSFGIVTLWKNERTYQKIALKQCKMGLENSLSESQKRRWCKEIEIMFQLNYPNIVRAITLPEKLKNIINCSLPVLCMEYCSKGDLRQMLNQPENCCGLPEKDVRNFLNDVKNALEYLHNLNITHRDLKPENILLQKSSYMTIYKLTDLGYAKELDQNGICSSFVGTLQYLAPELFLGEIYTNSVDYWSFGLILFETITGIRPFLPQTPPVLWMKYVKNKRHNHICVYQSTTGHIRYSTRIFSENQISSCFQHEIEKWLQIVLEWNAEKRGIESNQIIIFNRIDDICQKKILTLFCSTTCDFLSYEVDNSTAISTLLRWIERDTKIPPNLQILLSSEGKEVNREKFAADYYFPEEEVMLYICKTDALVLPRIKPRLPDLVMKMMENPLEMLSYFYLKRTIAQAIHFLRSEMRKYRSFLNICKIKIFRITNLSQYLNSICDNILLELNKILSNQKMCSKLLSFDLKCYNHLREKVSQLVPNVEETVTHWQSVFHTLAGKVNRILSSFHKLKTQCNKKVEDVKFLQNQFKTEDTGFNKFEEFVKLGYKCFENLPSDREAYSTPVEAVKIVHDFLKYRRLCLGNQKFDQYLRNLHIQEIEIQNLEKDVTTLKSHILQIKSEILNVQFIRHKNMWQFVASALTNQESKIDKVDTEESKKLINSSSVGYISSKNVGVGKEHISVEMLHCNSLDTEQMIIDNEHLRNQMLDSLQETIDKYHLIKDESDSIDWGFLNADDRNN